MSELQEELDFLESELSQLGSPIVFCHNDALLANVIYNKKENDVMFIDFEYAAFNYQAFDIGNHFNEFAGKENFVDFILYRVILVIPSFTEPVTFSQKELNIFILRIDTFIATQAHSIDSSGLTLTSSTSSFYPSSVLPLFIVLTCHVAVIKSVLI